MEEKDVQRLLDMLYSMIDEAKSAAFSSDKCVISRDEALDLLDDIRAKLPLEIKKAQELVRAREEYVSSAKKEVEKMLRQAELDAKVIVSESETLQQARRKSSEIIRRAEERSKELYHVANTYTEDALRRTEEAIQAALDEVKESRVRFRATSNEQMQANQEKLRERRSASEQPPSDEDAALCIRLAVRHVRKHQPELFHVGKVALVQLLLELLPLGVGINGQAAVLPHRHVEGISQLLPQLGRDKQAALGINIVKILARHACFTPFPQLFRQISALWAAAPL